MRLKIVLIVAVLLSSVTFTSCSWKGPAAPYRTTFNQGSSRTHYGTRGNYNNRHQYWGKKKHGRRQRGKYQ